MQCETTVQHVWNKFMSKGLCLISYIPESANVSFCGIPVTELWSGGKNAQPQYRIQMSNGELADASWDTKLNIGTLEPSKSGKGQPAESETLALMRMLVESMAEVNSKISGLEREIDSIKGDVVPSGGFGDMSRERQISERQTI